MSLLLEILVDLQTIAMTALCVVAVVWLAIGIHLDQDHKGLTPTLVATLILLVSEIVLNAPSVAVIIIKGSCAILNVLAGY